MNLKPFFLTALVGFAVPAVHAEDKKLTADLIGDNEVTGISQPGLFVGDAVPSYQRLPTSGKLSIVTKNGRLHRVETYTEWSAANGVRGRVWEKLWVSGGTYTGWSERLLMAGETISFSRNVIDGDIEQEIQPDGGGYIEWTVAGVNNDLEPAVTDDDANASSGADSDEDLPTVEILDEGEFDGISDRRIEIQTHGDDDPTVTFRDEGYSRVVLDEETEESVTIDQKLELEGEGDGDLRYDPRDDSTPSPTPTATPVPSPTPDLETD